MTTVPDPQLAGLSDDELAHHISHWAHELALHRGEAKQHRARSPMSRISGSAAAGTTRPACSACWPGKSLARGLMERDCRALRDMTNDDEKEHQ